MSSPSVSTFQGTSVGSSGVGVKRHRRRRGNERVKPRQACCGCNEVSHSHNFAVPLHLGEDDEIIREVFINREGTDDDLPESKDTATGGPTSFNMPSTFPLPPPEMSMLREEAAQIIQLREAQMAEEMGSASWIGHEISTVGPGQSFEGEDTRNTTMQTELPVFSEVGEQPTLTEDYSSTTDRISTKPPTSSSIRPKTDNNPRLFRRTLLTTITDEAPTPQPGLFLSHGVPLEKPKNLAPNHWLSANIASEVPPPPQPYPGIDEAGTLQHQQNFTRNHWLSTTITSEVPPQPQPRAEINESETQHRQQNVAHGDFMRLPARLCEKQFATQPVSSVSLMPSTIPLDQPKSQSDSYNRMDGAPGSAIVYDAPNNTMSLINSTPRESYPQASRQEEFNTGEVTISEQRATLQTNSTSRATVTTSHATAATSHATVTTSHATAAASQLPETVLIEEATSDSQSAESSESPSASPELPHASPNLPHTSPETHVATSRGFEAVNAVPLDTRNIMITSGEVIALDTQCIVPLSSSEEREESNRGVIETTPPGLTGSTRENVVIIKSAEELGTEQASTSSSLMARPGAMLSKDDFFVREVDHYATSLLQGEGIQVLPRHIVGETVIETGHPVTDRPATSSRRSSSVPADDRRGDGLRRWQTSSVDTVRLTSTATTGHRVLEQKVISENIYQQNTEEFSLVNTFGAANVGRDEFGEYLIKRVEVHVPEERVTRIPKKEVRETVIEKKVPQIVEVEKVVEVPEVKEVVVTKEVERIEEKIVHKPVRQVVERLVEQVVYKTVVVPVTREEIKEVPGQTVYVEKKFVQERVVVVPRYVDRRIPTVVVQSFWPRVTEASPGDPNAYIDVECKIYNFVPIPQNICVPKIVQRPMFFNEMTTKHKEIMLHLLPDEQYNALIKTLNPTLGLDHATDIFRFAPYSKITESQKEYCKVEGLGYLALTNGAGTVMVEPKLDSVTLRQFGGLRPTPPSSQPLLSLPTMVTASAAPTSVLHYPPGATQTFFLPPPATHSIIPLSGFQPDMKTIGEYNLMSFNPIDAEAIRQQSVGSSLRESLGQFHSLAPPPPKTLSWNTMGVHQRVPNELSQEFEHMSQSQTTTESEDEANSQSESMIIATTLQQLTAQPLTLLHPSAQLEALLQAASRGRSEKMSSLSKKRQKGNKRGGKTAHSRGRAVSLPKAPVWNVSKKRSHSPPMFGAKRV